MTDATCKDLECLRVPVAHGWCLMHYKRWWRSQGGPWYRPNPGCLIESCLKPHRAKGYCEEHYDFLRRNGDPLGRIQASPHEALEYFRAHVSERLVGCRIWPYRINENGYGTVNFEALKGPRLVHRLACEERWGPPPPLKYEAAHLPIVCHDRACWNGDHVRWASRQDQVDDMRLDGTLPWGERAGSAKLTEAQVLEIRLRYAAGGVYQRELGERFGVSQTQIGAIVRRKTWKHI